MILDLLKMFKKHPPTIVFLALFIAFLAFTHLPVSEKTAFVCNAGTVLFLGWWRGELRSLWSKGDSLDQFSFDSSVRSPTD
jgi:hypothetical protein